MHWRPGPWDGPGEVHKEGAYKGEGPAVPSAPWVQIEHKCMELVDIGGKNNEALGKNLVAVAAAYLTYQKGL